MDELTRELTHLGLTEKEASVYLAAAELGPSVAQDIAKKAKVNRATTYVMIDMLKTRGLMSSYSKGKKKFFVAESPERLLGMIRLQRQELESREEEFARIMPQLAALYNVEGTKPQVRFLEGL
ncbi:TrmB family transcriptional regulator, partial [Patescibacteria group bacterium]|nr:TrmB family transcriptional regulator [Patescibacteria group bacterium]